MVPGPVIGMKICLDLIYVHTASIQNAPVIELHFNSVLNTEYILASHQNINSPRKTLAQACSHEKSKSVLDNGGGAVNARCRILPEGNERRGTRFDPNGINYHLSKWLP